MKRKKCKKKQYLGKPEKKGRPLRKKRNVKKLFFSIAFKLEGVGGLNGTAIKKNFFADS